MTHLTTLIDNIRAALADNHFEGQFEAQYIRTAARLAFTLAFCSQLTSDEQATCASRRGTVRA